MPELVTEVRQISHIAYGFIASKALFAALNLGLFKHLANGPIGLPDLSQRSGVSENRLATLLACLSATGLVGRDGELFVNSPAAARYLVPGEPAYFGDYYRFQIDRQIYPNMLALDAGLAGDEAGLAHESMSGWLGDAEHADSFSRAQHAGSMGPALLMANTLDYSNAGSLLDVAGGTGAYSIVLCQRNPGLRSTILDFPTVTDIAERYIAEAGLGDRIGLLPGDALKTDWPGDQDEILMSYLISAVGEADIPELLERGWAALKPGGRLVIHDFMLDQDRAGPFSAAAFFLSYLALRTDPISFTAADLEPLVATAGFGAMESGVMIPGITKYMTARKAA